MKNIILPFLLIYSIGIYSQEKSIKIKDLELPNSPAFTILDYSPTIISNPKTTQELTANLISTASGGSLPSNYALEFTPYWVFSGTSKSLKLYLDGENKDLVCKPYKNLSFSMASVKIDSLQNISFGIRTNILTINNDKVKQIVKETYANLEKINKVLEEKLDLEQDPYEAGSDKSKKWQAAKLDLLEEDTYKDLTKSTSENMDAIKKLNSKPYLSIDIASAYNHFFDNKEFQSGKFGRFGVWTTINENLTITQNDKNYLCLYQYARFLINEMKYDTITKNYLKERSLDIGFKVDLQFDNLTFGYEYVLRTNEANNYRSVGNIKYKISDSIILNGGFGKNFEKADSLISFFGISFGVTKNNELMNK